MSEQLHLTRVARTLSQKGRNTRALILKSSLQVITEQGYFGASVSEIVRHCGVSQGTFYQYFKNKEQVLLELTDHMVDEFAGQANDIASQNGAPEELVHQAVTLLFRHTRENLGFIRVLGDLELIDPVTIAYCDSVARFLRQMMRRLAIEGHVLPLDPNLVAYGLIGITQFQLMDIGAKPAKLPEKKAIDLIFELIWRGISPQRPWVVAVAAADSPQSSELSPPNHRSEGLSQGQRTKLALFQAAERIFGQVGYNRARIVEITRAARVAQGTFYVHFSSKLELLEGVIRYLSSELRWALRQAVAGCQDRRDAESKGMLAFYRFIRQHRELYRIVAECDAVSPEVARWYYSKLAQGYTTATEIGVARGEIRPLPVDFLVRALMGFNHMIGMKWLIWNSSPHAEVPPQLAEEATNLIINGLSPA